VSGEATQGKKRVRILTAGRMSVGKTSLVNALWGEAGMLPTAARDCTQTNTLVRPPGWGSPDGTVRLRYLPPDTAAEYALGGVHWHRLTEYLRSQSPGLFDELEKLEPRAAIGACVKAVREVFAKEKGEEVLHDNLLEDLDVLESLLSLFEEVDRSSSLVVERPYEERSRHLMGERHPDGSIAGTGRLIALERVEIFREPKGWSACVPSIFDTPWIPTVHETRRADLVRQAAAEADVLVLVELPRRPVLEEWQQAYLDEDPTRARRVLFVLNQVDAVNLETFFRTGGLCEVFEETRTLMGRRGMDPENIVLTVSWVHHLRGLAPDDRVRGRIARMEAVLGDLRAVAKAPRCPPPLSQRILAACDPSDGGLAALRSRIEGMA
jgi:hypothetical protein